MRRIRFGLGILFILVGLFFLSNAWWKDQVAVSNSQRVTEGLQLKQPKSGEFDFSAVAPLSWNDLVTVRNRFHELPTIGVISVPEIKLELPIMYGLEADNLAVGAGTMRPNQQMGLGNYALAGHYTQSPTSLFGPLHEIETGMSVYVTDLTHTYEYVVTSLETVPPSRVDVLDETIDPTITLVTCTFDATERLIVKGRLAQTTPYAP
ncbi:MAG: class A sortase [Exiguobacterium sp.]|uniref:Class A sortase n=1 Tax=Exiguobacterium alkaliphilum TaxID=1428684 RepID=A0ABT2L1P7_9BACL|nr:MULTISPECIES: class A sortase [Exiguobacterium]MDX5322432.1 class A sortase [Exiguobacterium sp.]KDN59380.1 sortase [Exiguobacterium sp. AB2]MCT4796254.1 class A sortase [Exiguobacterium alkaliphilum]MDX5424157.1 class A sortase [Exiguobacterium sp.]MDX6771679.1 class A sortase [Exiguobacterium sp.]